MPVPVHLPSAGFPAGQPTGPLNQRRIQRLSAGRQTTMPKRQRIWYIRYAPVHLFQATAGRTSSPDRARRSCAPGLLAAHNVQFFPGSIAATLKPEARTMCRELKMSELFCKALKLKVLREQSKFSVHVSQGRHFRVPRGEVRR